MTTAFISGVLSWELPGLWMLDDDPHQSSCRSCAAPILWARNAASGKRAPFDPLPAGTPLEGQTVSGNHFATCPDADRWRKPREGVAPPSDKP